MSQKLYFPYHPMLPYRHEHHARIVERMRNLSQVLLLEMLDDPQPDTWRSLDLLQTELERHLWNEDHPHYIDLALALSRHLSSFQLGSLARLRAMRRGLNLYALAHIKHTMAFQVFGLLDESGEPVPDTAEITVWGTRSVRKMRRGPRKGAPLENTELVAWLGGPDDEDESLEVFPGTQACAVDPKRYGQLDSWPILKRTDPQPDSVNAGKRFVRSLEIVCNRMLGKSYTFHYVEEAE